MKYITGFFAFWYDFIVGDSWEVAAGVLLALLLLYGAVQVWGSGAAMIGALALPLIIMVVLGFSLRRTH